MAINKYFGNLNTLAKRGATTALFGLMTALLVSCGGGGVDNGTPQQNGALSILPESGSMYANVPQVFNVVGGKPPYLIVSNEQALLPLNFTLNGNTFTTVPNNPGVTDQPTPGNQTDVIAVPFRTVIITVRDAAGNQKDGNFIVLQNFLTGYTYTVTTTATCGTSVAQACAGADSLISLSPISSGLRLPNKLMRFTASYGAFAFILNSTGITGPTVDATSDGLGNVSARIHVTPGAATQYAQFRLTDVTTGAYRDMAFVIINASGANTPLSVIPDKISLGGATTKDCGTGAFNAFVFGGLPPYSASPVNPNSISITPPQIAKSGDAFTVQVFNPNICLSPGTVVITDALVGRVTIDITTTVGTAVPVLPLNVAPTSLCIQDNGSAVINVTGGAASFVINSSNPGLVFASPTSGSSPLTPTLSAPIGSLGGVLGTSVALTITDGITTATVTVLRKTTCP